MTDTIDAEVTATESLLAPLQEAQDVAVREESHPVATIRGEGETIRSAILELARDATFDVEKLKALTEMQERAEDRQAQRLFAIDMAAAQSECQAVVRRHEAKMITKEGENKGSWTFADLNDIDEMLRPIRTKYGFSVTHDRRPRTGDGGGLEVISTLLHRGGHSITASFPLALDSGAGKNNLQAAGSTDSYGRKYNVLGFFDVIRKNDDNDGADAGLKPLSNDAEGRKKAERIRVLVQQAAIGEGLPKEKRAEAIKNWFKTDARLDYEIGNYLDLRTEDFSKAVRLLLLEVQVQEARARKEGKI